MEFSLENITVHYELFGKGKPIIILPGWGNSAHLTAKWLEPTLQQRQLWKRIYIDPPGHGKTPGQDGITNQDKMLDVIIELIDKITNGQRFVLIGHSLGAYLARGVIYRRPGLVDGVCMIVPGIIAEDAKRTVPPHTILVEDPEVVAELTPSEAELFEIVVVRSRSTLNLVRAFFDEEMGDTKFLEKIRNVPERYAFSFDVDALSEPFLKPTLILTGRQDGVVGYRDAWKILDNYPRSTYVVFDRAGHLLEDKEQLISALVNEWLDRVEEGMGSK